MASASRSTGGASGGGGRGGEGGGAAALRLLVDGAGGLAELGENGLRLAVDRGGVGGRRGLRGGLLRRGAPLEPRDFAVQPCEMLPQEAPLAPEFVKAVGHGSPAPGVRATGLPRPCGAACRTGRRRPWGGRAARTE